MIGFSLWWFVAPEPLLLKPEALTTPDMRLLFKVVRDTFVNKVCSSHPEVSSPCDCGEPLNSIARKLFDQERELAFRLDNKERSTFLYRASILVRIQFVRCQ